MDELEKMRLAMNRTHELGRRNTAEICAEIRRRSESHTQSRDLDKLFAFGERIDGLFRRIYARYNAARPQWMRAMWGEE
jgi:hypothetical protein